MHYFLIARLKTGTPRYGVLCYNAILFFTSRTLSVSNTNHRKDGTFNVFSLINSCGLSPEKALKLSKRLELKNPDGANAVMDLLRNYGFSQTQLCRLVKKIPSVLLSKPDKTLLPKLKFFHSIGFSTTDLPRFLIGNTSFLGLSLDKTIIPRYEIVKSLVHGDKEVVSTLKHDRWYFNRGMFINDSVQNVGALRQLGVPQRSISFLVTNFPSVTFMKHSRFAEAMEKVGEMGFDPLKSNFVLALQVLAKMDEAMWKSKLEVFERWGWSRDICLSAFKKHPQFMMLSEKKIMKILSFLMEDMGLPLEDIARCPVILKCNLEKTVIPRFAVVKILKSRGLTKRDLKISSFIKISEKVFLERYVTRFQKNEPLLLDAYKGLKSN
ncbi:Mitochodrial transcription termination factor-related [Spatholobus suberectus]|nr:Mitochodrial transcription termination factor-related [Spatholobus suberectus]